ncbi:MAG: LVIVD repeat-containing protein [Burkholderiales bacterium]
MSKAKGIREVAYVDIKQGGGVQHSHGSKGDMSPMSWFDCAGGGQVVVERGIAYVGNMRNPDGTMIIDVKDPKHPKLLSKVTMPPGTHSHKVRAKDGIMVTNREILSARGLKGEVPPDDFKGGLGIYDVSNPSQPKLITNWETDDKPGVNYARGVHRFDFDGRYAYISPTMDGYVGNIMMILDLKDPARPQEVGRWWAPGQWTAGGESPTWKGAAYRCHHPLRYENRLYTSYWHGGFYILDIDDMAKPKFVSGLNWHPPFPWPTHTCLRMPFKIENRDVMVVTDEDVIRLEGCPPYPSAFLWILDITDEKHPTPISTFQLEGIPPEEQPYMTGCHQPSEQVRMGTEIPVAWFAHGLRIVDIARPHAPKEVAYFMPDVPPGSTRVQSNDVTVDERGLIFLLDRVRGMHILERVA